jgi:peroxiredoxin
MQLNEPAPEIELPDLDGQLHRLSHYRGKVVVINFWSAECPWSERTDRALLATLNQLAGQVALLPIASNENEPDEQLREAARQRGLPFVLRDLGGRAAALYNARTTPHAFVLDPTGILRYQGAVDDVTFRHRTPSRWYVEEAVEALLEGRLPIVQDAPPYGCAIVRHI